MNPFNTYRKSYITACFMIAVIYAFVIGAVANIPVVFRIVDGFIYGSILLFAGNVLHTFFRFALPVYHLSKYRIIFISLCAVITAMLLTGVETFSMYLFFPSTFAAFVPTLPVRVFVAILLFIITYQFYLFSKEQTGENQEIAANSLHIDASLPIENQSGESETSTHSVNLPIDRFAVRSGQKIKIIPINSIIYIKADGDYISIHTMEGKWLKEQTMKYTEDRLPMDTFVRIHRSYIVNIHHISRIERYGEKQLIILHNNEKIKISASRYQLLKQILGF
jgi:hypothetical protein